MTATCVVCRPNGWSPSSAARANGPGSACTCANCSAAQCGPMGDHDAVRPPRGGAAGSDRVARTAAIGLTQGSAERRREPIPGFGERRPARPPRPRWPSSVAGRRGRRARRAVATPETRPCQKQMARQAQDPCSGSTTRVEWGRCGTTSTPETVARGHQPPATSKKLWISSATASGWVNGPACPAPRTVWDSPRGTCSTT